MYLKKRGTSNAMKLYSRQYPEANNFLIRKMPVVRFLQRHIRPVALFTSKRSYCGAFSSTSKINKKHAPPHSVWKCIPSRFSEHRTMLCQSR